MKVEAIREGYYNHRRVYKGQVFELANETEFSEAWMKSDSDKPMPAPRKVVEQEEILPDDSVDDEVI